ncbi:hypothetical protein [Actinomadura sediminis]|uniref:Uncharacterized protein n=1 Tax=Actinomadura sediminis TaxID=1038904 RepID=A0ABW3EP04_9ACTN
MNSHRRTYRTPQRPAAVENGAGAGVQRHAEGAEIGDVDVA